MKNFYERGNKGTIMSMYEYKVTSEEAKVLTEI